MMNASRPGMQHLTAILLMIVTPAWAWACATPRVTQAPSAEPEVLESKVSPEPPSAASAEGKAARSGPALGDPTPVLVLQDGQVPEGGLGAPVERLNSPFTNGLGQVAFSGALDRKGVLDHFVWWDGSILWLASEHAEDALDGAESTLGVSDTGEFVVGTLAAGVDSVWSHQGRVLAVGMPAPGFPQGSVIEGLLRATMTPAGRFHTFAEVRLPLLEGMKRRETLSRALFGSAGVGQPIAPVLKSGDEVDGSVIAFVDGLGLDYQVSDNGEHLIQVVRVVDPARGKKALPALYVDDRLPLRSGHPTSNGEMTEFDLVAINDAGHYLIAGETDGDPNGDYFLAYDGVPAVWEQAPMPTAEPGLLRPPAVVRGVSIDNRGRAVYSWSTAGFGTEYLFFACDASNLADSVLLLDSARKVDLDGDGENEARIIKFNGGNGPTLSLSEQDEIYIEVDLGYDDGARRESILEIPLPVCEPGA